MKTPPCSRFRRGALAVAGLLSAAACAQDQVQFRWAVLIASDAGRAETSAPPARLEMKSGDQFRLYVQSEAKQFLYVLFQDSGGALNGVYPPPGQPYGGTPVGEELYLPGKAQWFALDEKKGRETFRILATSTRPEALEGALKELAAGKPDAAGKALAEIKALTRRHSALSRAGEKPVPIAGSSRGPGAPPVTTQEVGRGFLNKIIDIEHR